jgi:hypothetical protein
MKKTAAILLSIYIIIQSIYFMVGDTESNVWSCLFYLNQNFIIFSVLWMLRGYFNDILISIVMSLNITEGAFNVIYLIDKTFAEKINNSHYIAFVIVMTVIIMLLIKLSENDRSAKKRMGQATN